jgi:hypothetical protein
MRTLTRDDSVSLCAVCSLPPLVASVWECRPLCVRMRSSVRARSRSAGCSSSSSSTASLMSAGQGQSCPIVCSHPIVWDRLWLCDCSLSLQAAPEPLQLASAALQLHQLLLHRLLRP